jgi:hypothetical protein
MVKKENFRYRGPIESRKVNQMTINIRKELNKLIEQAGQFLNQVKQDEETIINNAKRRGYM